VLDDHLVDRPWIAQDKLTLADPAIGAQLMHMAAAKLPVLDYTNLQRWFAGIVSLDAWRKHGANEDWRSKWCGYRQPLLAVLSVPLTQRRRSQLRVSRGVLVSVVRKEAPRSSLPAVFSKT
jgi:glutathione S-transferase-like protein